MAWTVNEDGDTFTTRRPVGALGIEEWALAIDGVATTHTLAASAAMEPATVRVKVCVDITSSSASCRAC